jgi:hypothetical protein
MTGHTDRSKGALFTPTRVAAGTERTEVVAAPDGIYWLEHSHEEARARVMRATSAGDARQVTPAGVDAGTLAWEYGGGSYLVTAAG